MKLAKVMAVFIALLLMVPTASADAATKKSQKITWSGVKLASLGSSVAISAKASSKLTVKVTNASPAICTVTASTLTALAIGDCNFTLSQAGNKTFKPAASIKATVKVTAVTRNMIDQKDSFSGFQIHPIYVVPADATDRQLDINGGIAALLDEGNAFLKREIGATLPIDSTTSGYDIDFMKSKYSAQSIMDMKPSQLKYMMNELMPFNTPSANRKDYVFFIDVPALNSNYCGWADMPGLAAVVALGGPADTKHKCSGTGGGLKDYASKTWVHEVFHNLGVAHTPTVCDLMYVGSTTCTGNFRIDAARKLYVDATSSYGPDVLSERVWTEQTSSGALSSPCYVNLDDYLRNDSVPFAYCPTGTVLVGDHIACYDKLLTSATLQKLVDGAWVEVGPGVIVSKPWGDAVDFSCSGTYPVGPSASVTQTTPATIRFRWQISKTQFGDPFDVIFAK